MEKTAYKILALKYRPKNFKELIGQNVMVETLTNSFKSNRIAQAFMLTGERGTGKTSTARIISKSLTCTGNFLEGEKCKTGEICHCEEIANDKHLDVIECDAASRTGVDDVRQIIDAAKYKPTTAKYKIYIIDECHMLSRNAWNALLKTLEEPPESLKFIFCTTEPKKVPITIVSRCQTFNLHRISIKVLSDHLKKISKIENRKLSEPAIKLIAKASTGSVRDALSLLDRALVDKYASEGEIDEVAVRNMLGIGNRSEILKLLKFIFDGNEKKSIESLRKMIDEGIDVVNLKNDILELLYFILQKKNLGDFDSDLSISESELEMIDFISKDVSTSTLILFWQFTLKALEEDKLLMNPLLGLEMLVFRLLHLVDKEVPSFEDLVKNIPSQIDEFASVKKVSKKISDEKGEINKISKDQIKNTTQTKPELTSLSPKNTYKESIKSFEDLVKLSALKREIELKYDLERVNLIKFTEGKIDIAFSENLSKNFVRNLSKKLLIWTSKRWVITLTKGPGQKTFLEKKTINKEDLLKSEKKSDVYQKFKNIFSDGELVEVSKKD